MTYLKEKWQNWPPILIIALVVVIGFFVLMLVGLIVVPYNGEDEITCPDNHAAVYPSDGDPYCIALEDLP